MCGIHFNQALWQGLKLSLDQLAAAQRVAGQPRLAAVLLLTDGCPNVNPAEGHMVALQAYMTANPNFHAIVSTFGFGYSLDSALLSEISYFGQGMYTFIPDASFVGTAFVNVTANLLATQAHPVTLTLECQHGTQIVSVPGRPAALSAVAATRLEFPLGAISFGQSRDTLVHLQMPEEWASGTPYLEASLTWTNIDGTTHVTRAVGVAEDGARVVDLHAARLDFFDTVTCAWDVKHPAKDRAAALRTASLKLGGKAFADATEAAQALLTGLAERVRAAADRVGGPQIAALLEDIEGQVSLAFSRDDYFAKWGIHYIPALLCAHFLQQSNNFKDPGLQHYGGELFQSLQNHADSVFLSLPPPQKQSGIDPEILAFLSEEEKAQLGLGGGGLALGAPAAAAGPVAMSRYMDRGNGCIAGHCWVTLASGQSIRVSELQQGDCVQTCLDSDTCGSATVRCVVRWATRDGLAPLVTLPSGLMITPWHPVRSRGAWQFPHTLSPVVLTRCVALYSFLLDGGVALCVNGVECAALGHGLVQPIIHHPFYGSRQHVMEALKNLPGFASGLVQLGPDAQAVRDAQGLVCGFQA